MMELSKHIHGHGGASVVFINIVVLLVFLNRVRTTTSHSSNIRPRKISEPIKIVESPIHCHKVLIFLPKNFNLNRFSSSISGRVLILLRFFLLAVSLTQYK